MLDELKWPSLEACRDQSSLLLFHKIHSGAVSIEKDKYLTPAHSLKSTRASHSAQYCRYQTYGKSCISSYTRIVCIPYIIHGLSAQNVLYSFIQWSFFLKCNFISSYIWFFLRCANLFSNVCSCLRYFHVNFRLHRPNLSI